MKCKICGAELRKDGDICNKCYEKLVKEEELENDKKALYELKMKYVPRFWVYKNGRLFNIWNINYSSYAFN